jgi:hypothetical protein
MKTLTLLLASTLALASFPAAAHAVRSHFGVGVGLGAPYYLAPYGYDPWLYPWAYTWYPPPRGSDATAELYVYPRAGQDEAQVAEDRGACHDWAAAESKFDPQTAKRQRATDLANYNRAFTACMEGRNYSVE